MQTLLLISNYISNFQGSSNFCPINSRKCTPLKCLPNILGGARAPRGPPQYATGFANEAKVILFVLFVVFTIIATKNQHTTVAQATSTLQSHIFEFQSLPFRVPLKYSSDNGTSKIKNRTQITRTRHKISLNYSFSISTN